MEQLLARKIEAAAQSVTGPGGTRLRRTDSLDSTSSIGSLGSLILGDDVCRCDDCLLGIVDLYVISAEAAKKKVRQTVEWVKGKIATIVFLSLKEDVALITELIKGNFTISLIFCIKQTTIYFIFKKNWK